MSRGRQGGGIYAVILSIRTMVGGRKHRPRLDRLHCGLCTRPGYYHNSIGRVEPTTTIPSLRTFAGYYRMAAVFRRNDFKRNCGSTVTVLHSQQFPDEFGQMVNWTHHTAAGDYTWSVVVLKFHVAQPGLRGNCDCKKGGAAIGDRTSTGSGGCRVTRGGQVPGVG
jgi:hypothetical protein